MRILLIEDHDDTRNVMHRLLRRSHDVTTAITLAEAKQLCTAGQFDLVIADLGLPDGDGIELGMITKQCGIKAIALTGYGMTADIKKSREAGFAAHIVKPASIDKIEATIIRVMRLTDSASSDLGMDHP